jgi:hypothetical protein
MIGSGARRWAILSDSDFLLLYSVKNNSTHFSRSCHEQKGSIPEKPPHPVTSQNINIFLDRYHVDIYTFPKGGMKWGRVER